jgi:putative aldouronate transport system permease protein
VDTAYNPAHSKLQHGIATAVILLVITAAAIVCLLPLIHELALSFSSNEAVMTQRVWFLPVEFSVKSYIEVFKDSSVFRSLLFSLELTGLYTVMAMALTLAAAYPLTRPEMKGRSFFMTIIVITMYFSGGILPTYILLKTLGMLNTMWSLIFPVVINPFYLIILRTSLSGLPDSITESALMDGASYFRILAQIVVPLSMPIIATLSLFYAVFRWNAFQDALFYITNTRMYTLQEKLSYIVLDNSAIEKIISEGALALDKIVPTAITAATVMVATVPILIIYPWLQRYFISGVMIGSIKG